MMLLKRGGLPFLGLVGYILLGCAECDIDETSRFSLKGRDSMGFTMVSRWGSLI